MNEEYGIDNVMKIIKECIPPFASYPILHHVIKNSPRYMNDFARQYPSAVFLIDEQQRLLVHVASDSGTTVKTDAMMILRMKDEEMAEKNPVSDLYPFMIATSAGKCDLSPSNYLLRRNPAVLDDMKRLANHKQSRRVKSESVRTGCCDERSHL